MPNHKAFLYSLLHLVVNASLNLIVAIRIPFGMAFTSIAFGKIATTCSFKISLIRYVEACRTLLILQEMQKLAHLGFRLAKKNLPRTYQEKSDTA